MLGGAFVRVLLLDLAVGALACHCKGGGARGDRGDAVTGAACSALVDGSCPTGFGCRWQDQNPSGDPGDPKEGTCVPIMRIPVGDVCGSRQAYSTVACEPPSSCQLVTVIGVGLSACVVDGDAGAAGQFCDRYADGGRCAVGLTCITTFTCSARASGAGCSSDEDCASGHCTCPTATPWAYACD